MEERFGGRWLSPLLISRNRSDHHGNGPGALLFI